MRSAFELPTPRAHELSVPVKNNNRVRRFAGGMNRVMNVDMALRVFADAVRVPVSDIGRQRAPIVERLVLMFPFTKNRRAAAGFVGCSEKERRHSGCAGGGEEGASGDFHGL